MTAFDSAITWIQDVTEANAERFTLAELRAANRVLLQAVECPWGPEEDDPVPFASCTLFEKLKRWFNQVVEVPSRLRPREYAEAQAIVVEILNSKGNGGPADVRTFTKPCKN